LTSKKLSYGTTCQIISDVLGYSRVAQAGCQECVICMQTSNCNLDLYVADPVKFLRRYVTENKTCAFHFDSNETTKYVVEAPNLTSSGQISTDHIGHKVMVSVVWDREGMSDN